MKSVVLFFLLFASLLWVSPTVAKSVDNVKVQLSWRHQFQFAGFYAAVKKGYYSDSGLNVTLLEGGPDVNCDERTLRVVAHYCIAPGSVIRRKLAGERLVALASIFQNSPIVLLTRKDSGLDTPSSLIGKRVESMLVGEPIVEIQAMFQKQGIDLSMLINLENSVGTDALVSGKVDAMLGFISNEPRLLERQSIEFNIINPVDYGVDFYGDVLLTSDTEIKRNADRAARFRAATIKGWDYALKHKAEMVSYITQHYDNTKTTQALLAEAKAIERLMLPNLIEIGRHNVSRWEASAATLAAIDGIDASYSLDSFIYGGKPPKDSDYIGYIVNSGLFLLLIGLVSLWFYNRRLRAEVALQIQSKERLRAEQHLAKQQAYTDELTGMGNRRSCYELGAAAVELSKENEQALSIIMIDIDYFKRVNDVYGHAVGDEFICMMAKVIFDCIGDNDIQGRIGGEEFVVISPSTGLRCAARLAEKIRVVLENTEILVDGKPVYMTASLGVAALTDQSSDIKTIMKQADEALYQAKGDGRNRVIVYQFSESLAV